MHPSWTQFKVLPGKKGPTVAISPGAQYDACKAVFANHSIFSTKITHGGRHAGAREAEQHGVSRDDIAAGGRWMVGQNKLGLHYLSRLPIRCAFAMAGFKDKPFSLPRNKINPPIELQRTIFGWIEEVFGAFGTPEYDAWAADCLRYMQETHENVDVRVGAERDFRQMETVTASSSSSSSGAGAATGAGRVARPASVVALRGFLAMLVRFRKVILQDAAVMLHKGWMSTVIDNEVFQTPLFLRYQEELVAVLDELESNALHQYEPMVPELVDGFRSIRDDHTSQFQQMRLQIQSMQATQQAMLQSQQAM